jgi:ABC-type thiamine transport system ATPase subunit
MAALVLRLTRERSLATLVVSHDPADAGRLGSRAVALRDGKIVIDGFAGCDQYHRHGHP